MTISASLVGGGLLLFAALTDIRWRTIPNRIVLLVALAGVVVRWGDGASVLLVALAISGLIFAVMLLFFHLGAVGGGDVKLLAAASLLSAPDEVGGQLVMIALAGGAMALLYMLRGFCLHLECKNAVRSGQDAKRANSIAISRVKDPQNELPGFRSDGLPYGVAICIGTLANMALSK